MRIAVVGAGFAGLMAAIRLNEMGHQVVVLEARDRVGGRVWSQRLDPTDPRTVIERGAEFVLDGYDSMRATAAALGLSFADMGMSYYVREPRGGLPTTAEQVAACAALVAEAAAQLPWGTPLSKLLDEMGSVTDRAALAAFASRLAVTNASSEHGLSAAVVEDLAVAFDPLPSCRLAGGNQSLATGLADRLGDSVRLAVPVRAITWGPGEVTLRTDRDELDVDAAVLATPMAVTRELAFEPAIPDWKLGAWERSGIGHAAKLHVPVHGVVGTGAVQNVPDRYWTWTATDASATVQPVLHAFAGSGQALTDLEVESGPREWARRVVRFRPDLALDPERALLTTWSDDPWAREAYTALTLEVQEGDDELLRRSVGPLYFAGEHTAGAWAGLMEGALRSGERVADEVATT